MSLTHLWRETIYGVPVIREMFIETGTKAGDTLWEAKDLFARCASIEISPSAFLEARKRFDGHDDNVKLLYGDSRHLLELIIDRMVATTFYLDAHCEGAPSSVNADTECPLLDELKVIVGAPWTVKPLVIIDDIHMFKVDYWGDPDSNHRLFDATDWPLFDEIEAIMGPSGFRYWEDPSGRIGVWS